jgi:predicted DNA-binding transcriptional regulator YafY
LVLAKEPAWADGFSHHARLALQLAELALQQGGSEFWAQYLPAFERLLAPHLTQKDRLLFDQLKDQLNYRGSVGKPQDRDPNVFLNLLDALATKPVPPQLEILYRRAWDERGAWITVVPYSITHDVLAGSAYLLAWDTRRLSAGHFRIGRIEAVKTNGRYGVLGSEPKSSLERARKFQVGGWFADTDPFEIEVEIHGKNWVKAFLDAPPALPDVKVVEVADGTGSRVRIQFRATELEGPSRWIMQIGPKAKVISPDHLREHLEANFRAAVAQYA